MQKSRRPASAEDTHHGTGLRECAICQTTIYAEEQTTPCPKCGLVYHVECWQLNLGCAAYGCDQVNALAPKPQPAAPAPPPSTDPVAGERGRAAGERDRAAERLPWSFVLLGAAALAAAGSALSYGVPSVVVAILVAARAVQTRRRPRGGPRDRILFAAAALCAVGVAAGVTLSRLWWTNE